MFGGETLKELRRSLAEAEIAERRRPQSAHLAVRRRPRRRQPAAARRLRAAGGRHRDADRLLRRSAGAARRPARHGRDQCRARAAQDRQPARHPVRRASSATEQLYGDADGRVPATFQVIYLDRLGARTPRSRSRCDREAPLARLAEALGTRGNPGRRPGSPVRIDDVGAVDPADREIASHRRSALKELKSALGAALLAERRGSRLCRRSCASRSAPTAPGERTSCRCISGRARRPATRASSPHLLWPGRDADG